MDEKSLLTQILSGQMDWIIVAVRLLAPPMFVISIVIQTVRESVASIFPDKMPIENSPQDRARKLILFFSPMIVALIYLLVVSGTWWVNGKKLELKEIVSGAFFLGLFSTFFYRHVQKPYLNDIMKMFFELIKNKFKKPSGENG